MKDFERKNTREMIEVRDFLLERVENCLKVKRQSLFMMILWFWYPPNYRRAKAIFDDAKNAELLYRSGIDVLNSHHGMKPTKMS